MSVQVCPSEAEFRRACRRLRREAGSVGFVPTMGALHAGHGALIRQARRQAGAAVVSIFVNPTQFGENEDFSSYPRSWESDWQQCRNEEVTAVFTPTVEQMYPPGEQTRIRVGRLTEHLCGASRPGHFEGVATIVAKLLAIVGPCVAVFGRKDYQQLKVIERMARDLMLPVRVVGHPVVREADGLALSSRNSYLSSAQREQARAIPRALSWAYRAHEAGEREVGSLRAEVQQQLQRAGLEIDYVTVADADELQPLARTFTVSERAVLAVAVRCGSTRLIDNLVFTEDPDPLPSEARA